MNIETYALKHPKNRPGILLPDSIRAIGSLPEGARVLDVGCAEGNTIQWLQEQFPHRYEWIGIDLSTTRIARARQKQIPGVNFLVGDVQSLPIDEGTIDFVISSQVIEPVPDERKMLREVSRVLVRGGRFQIDTVYKKKWAWYFYRSPSGWALDPTHLREYTDQAELVSRFPGNLDLSQPKIVQSLRKMNILACFSTLPDWISIPIPGYYVIFLTGTKREEQP